MTIKYNPFTSNFDISGPGSNATGDVEGPASSTDNAVVRYDGTTGKVLQNSNVLIDDSDNLSGVGNLSLTGTVDGRDIAADGTKLDTIETNADVTDETNVVSSLDGATLTAATVASTDKVLVQDVDDSDNLKTVTAQSIADLGGGGNYTEISSTTLSSDSTIEFTGLTNSMYLLEFRNVLPSSDGDFFRIRFSNDNGSTYSTADHNGCLLYARSNTTSAAGDNSIDDYIVLTDPSVGNSTDEYGISGDLVLFNMNNASFPAEANFKLVYQNTSGFLISNRGGFRTTTYDGTGALKEVDAIELDFLNGNLDSGTITLYEFNR